MQKKIEVLYVDDACFFWAARWLAVLSMQDDSSRSLFIAHIPAALPLRTRRFKSVVTPVLVGHAYAQTSHQATRRWGTSKTRQEIKSFAFLKSPASRDEGLAQA